MTDRSDWVEGDFLGLAVPAHPDALADGGAAYLTRALRTCGAISGDNRVADILRFEEISAGSTGRKVRLSIGYAEEGESLHRDLFVKFSRDFDDALRDRARYQMAREVRFALLSRNPDFPIAVPTCYAADFHRASGTGILITSCVPFDRNGVEPQREKCSDDELPDALPYYRALVQTLGRLAGSHLAGTFGPGVASQFPFEPAALAVSPRAYYTAEQVARRVERYAQFAASHPQLLPAHIRSAQFIARLQEEAPVQAAAAGEIEMYLAGCDEYLALCHWNANIDNAWFWPGQQGALHCGLFDWGNVSVMPVAMALWGCLSGAELTLWDCHLEQLLSLFADEVASAGGPALDPGLLQHQLLLHARVMGVNWLLDVPGLLQQAIPELASVSGRSDPLIRDSEAARTRLQMLCVFLNLWATRNPGPRTVTGGSYGQ